MMGKKKKVLLGTANFALQDYVGKIFEETVLTLTGGPLLNGKLLVKISIVPLPKA